MVLSVLALEGIDSLVGIMNTDAWTAIMNTRQSFGVVDKSVSSFQNCCFVNIFIPLKPFPAATEEIPLF